MLRQPIIMPLNLLMPPARASPLILPSRKRLAPRLQSLFADCQLALFDLRFLRLHQCAQPPLIDVAPAFRVLQVIEVGLRESQLLHPECRRVFHFAHELAKVD